MNVTVFSTTTCATCHLVTDWLDKKEIAYAKKNTDADPEAMMEFMEVNDGTIGVPFTVITKEDGSQEKILGFDKGKFETALDLK